MGEMGEGGGGREGKGKGNGRGGDWVAFEGIQSIKTIENLLIRRNKEKELKKKSA